MILPPKLVSQRDTIIKKHHKLIVELRAIENDIADCIKNGTKYNAIEEKRGDLQRCLEPLIEEYWQWIPDVALSQCPICGTQLLRKFDPVDFNGFWWMDRTQRSVKEPKHCEHFCLILGAVDYNDCQYLEPLFEMAKGQKEAFVIPRILEMPSMQVVISKIQMHNGFIAYPLCYFSVEKPKAGSLMQSWAQKEYRFTDETGKVGWDVKEEEYDYNLDVWIKQNKVSDLRGHNE